MEDIRQKIEKAKRDEDCFAELVREYEKHILYAAYRTVGHYVSKSDDEWSVAMMAFYEAVRSYDAEKGSFVKFSEMVIRRRVIDQLQHHGKYRPEVTADIEEEFSNEPAPERCGTKSRPFRVFWRNTDWSSGILRNPPPNPGKRSIPVHWRCRPFWNIRN